MGGRATPLAGRTERLQAHERLLGGAGACGRTRPRRTSCLRTYSNPSPAHGHRRLTAHGSRGDRPAGGYTVLVVDDEEAVRRLAVRMLTWTGYQAIEARHGREALAAIEEHNGPVHLVLTDMKMPGMNGRELGRTSRNAGQGNRSSTCPGSRRRCFRTGCSSPGRRFWPSRSPRRRSPRRSGRCWRGQPAPERELRDVIHRPCGPGLKAVVSSPRQMP